LTNPVAAIAILIGVTVTTEVATTLLKEVD